MILALTNGLCVALAALATTIFLRVAFRWREDTQTAPIDPALIGSWWRATWVVLTIGFIPPIVAHMSYAATPQFLDYDTRIALTLIGLALMNCALCLADMGFTLNRGAKLGAALPILALPVAFVFLAMVTA